MDFLVLYIYFLHKVIWEDKYMSDSIIYGSQEIKLVDRSTISLSGINKIVSFDDEEFLMESWGIFAFLEKI